MDLYAEKKYLYLKKDSVEVKMIKNLMRYSEYVCVKFSGINLFVVRLGGPGLGNLLFDLIEAYLYAREKRYRKLLRPILEQIKIGPIIRREDDKRFYFGILKESIFKAQGKLLLLKILSFFLRYKITKISSRNNYFIDFDSTVAKDFANYLVEISDHRYDVIPRYGKRVVGVHLRTTDFSSPDAVSSNLVNQVNIRSSIDWYIKCINIIDPAGLFDVRIFTDKADNIEFFKEIKNVYLDKSSNALAAILNLSNCDYIVASKSTFSLWAIFLGKAEFFIESNFEIDRYFSQDLYKERGNFVP